MSEKKDRFGRYLILDHLVDGGMAKICRARFLGEQADKVVAIKMIQPQYSSDDSFKQMFMDEIKVTFGLLHPNIVQTYDYGLHKDQLYVAMEYCDGRNLKEYLDRLRQKKFVFPVEISVYIISQVCQGLHYAHTFTDKLTGKAAQIVHRDISPHNIMLTYDGSVKIIDFGIAKANTNSEATQAGTIKGKLSYLAPEYLEGHQLDPRYDMFAVGITLWEMLCSRKLFKAANDLAVLKKIQECKVPPPSKINPNVPKELDDIVMKALRKDRNKRFENMDQFNRALIKFLYANYPDFNSSDLSYFAKELFKEEIRKDREKLFEFGKIDIMPYVNDWKREQEGGVGASSSSDSSESSGEVSSKRSNEQVLDFGFEEESTKTSIRVSAAARTRTKVKDGISGGAKVGRKAGEEIQQVEAGNLKVSAGAPKKRPTGFTEISDNGNTRTKQTRSGKKKSATRAATSTAMHDIQEQKKNQFIKIAIMVCVIGGVGWFGRNDLPFIKNIIGNRKPASQVNKALIEDKDEFNKANQEITGVAKELSSGLRIANFNSQYHRVYIDGEEVKPNYLKKIDAPYQKEFWLRVERAGYKPYVKRMSLTDHKSITTIKVPSMDNEAFGYAYVSRGCQMYGTLSFNLYGEQRTEKLPMASQIGIPFPVNGDGRTPADESGKAKFTLYFKKNGSSLERKIEIKFEHEEQRIDLCGL